MFVRVLMVSLGLGLVAPAFAAPAPAVAHVEKGHPGRLGHAARVRQVENQRIRDRILRDRVTAQHDVAHHPGRPERVVPPRPRIPELRRPLPEHPTGPVHGPAAE